MIKNIALIIIFFISQSALAKVMELDNKNIAHCQKQLENDDWTSNTLMLYVKNAPETNKFRAIYEQISTEQPDRHFFALNVFDPEADAKENQLIMKTVKECLTNMMHGREKDMGDINAKTPPLFAYDYSAATVGLKNNQISTKEDFLKFIGGHPSKVEKTP